VTNATIDPKKPVIDRFADGGPLLVQAVAGLTPEQARDHPIPGTWSVAELVAHLLDCDLVFSDRMKRIIAEDSPTLQAFDEQKWISGLFSNAMPIDEAAALFAANRKWMARILRALDESSFARTGQHTDKGRQTLAEVLAYATNHLDHHLKFLYAKRAKLGVAIYPRYTANTGM
jgi:uncharacterized damage-inducible protein DinB